MSAVKHPKWKLVLWAPDTVEPSMLRVPIVIIVFLVLWGVNVWFLDKLRIQYGMVLSFKGVSYPLYFGTICILLALYAVVMTLFSNSMGYSIVTGVTIFYLLVVIVHFLPISTGADSRSSFYRLLRSVCLPMGVVTFPEVLMADALTSISKVLKDFGTYLVVIYASVQGRDIIEYHNHAMILVACLASLPFSIRVRQCYLQLESCPDLISKIPVLLNIGKYISSFPPIWLTAATSLGYIHPSMPLFITVAAIINSVYSYLWDIIMDWGLVSIHRDLRLTRRSRTLLPFFYYPIAVILNLLLRFSWTINRLPSMSHVHSSVIVLVIEIGEVCRRAMWNMIRIEWEVIVQQDRALEKDATIEKSSKLLRSPINSSNQLQ